MRKIIIAGVSAMALLGTTSAFAAQKHGKYSQQTVRAACNATGGELLGVSDLGSYGCEFTNGAMVLCNKNSDCTIYTAARVRSQRNRTLAVLNRAARGLSIR